MTHHPLSSNFSTIPYWQSATTAMHDPQPELQRRTDVVVIGAGLTGAAAAETLAKAGREVVLLDAVEPGKGASSRNGAMLGRYFKHSFGSLMEQRGLDCAKAYFAELSEVYDFAVAKIDGLRAETGLRHCGRIVGAVTSGHRDRLYREWELRAKHNGEAVEFLEAGDPALPTDRYCGGIRIVQNASLQPALYTNAMLAAAVGAGTILHGQTPVQGVIKESNEFVVHTPRGQIRARDVVLATNGYTPSGQRWHHQRLIPIVAFMAATEPLPAEISARLQAGHSTYHDNRKNSTYYQLSSDGRLVLGGRTGLYHGSLAQLAIKLHQEICYFYPELAKIKITHAWTGRCAATGDLFPHVGTHDGVHFAMGYCFSGLAMAPWLGRKAALSVLGRSDEARSLFRLDDMPRVFWPKRQTWLMPLAMQYFRWREPLPQ